MTLLRTLIPKYPLKSLHTSCKNLQKTRPHDKSSMDGPRFREAAHNAIEDIISYFQTLPQQRVTPSINPGYLKPLLPSHAPEDPEPFPSLLSDVNTKIVPGLTHWQSPNFMAFFPANVTWPSIIGEMFSAAFTAPAFNWLCSPACTELETVVLDWVAKMCDLPDVYLSDGPTGGGGVIQGSASEAIVTVMVAAREQYIRRVLAKEGLEETKDESEERKLKREDRAAEIKSRLVALGSEQAHSATQKAANILGIRYRSVPVGARTQHRMTGAATTQTIENLTAQGLIPFYITATLGTTSVCAVDSLGEIAEAKQHYISTSSDPETCSLWIHVDAAYAGAALICPQYRQHLEHAHLSKVDSFNFNMHKWLMVNFDASVLYLQDRLPLTTAMSITPSYLQNPDNISGLVTDYRDWQIPLGRRFRALKIWFVLRTYGVKALQEWVRGHVELGEYFADLVRGRKDLFELVTGPSFALTTLRCLVPSSSATVVDEKRGTEVNGHDDKVNANGVDKNEAEMNDFEAQKKGTAVSEKSNALTKQICDLINSRGEIFITGAMVDGMYLIRFVSANPSAERKYVKRAFEILVSTTEEVLAAGGKK